MGMRKIISITFLAMLVLLLTSVAPCYPQGGEKEKALDLRVKKFLDRMKNRWQDWNVPEADGKILYEIILEE